MTFRHSLAVLAAAMFAGALHAEVAKPVDNTPKVASGLLMKQGGKLVFAPCRDRSYAMMDDISPEGMVTRALDGVGLAAGKKLYVELMAVLDGGMLRVSGLNLARAEGRCQQPGGNVESWRASGNEPGWLLAVGPEVVVLKRLGQPDVNVPGMSVSVARDGGVAGFEARSETARLKARFENKVCHDTTADAVFGWTATVDINGQTLKGCAWQR